MNNCINRFGSFCPNNLQLVQGSDIKKGPQGTTKTKLQLLQKI